MLASDNHWVRVLRISQPAAASTSFFGKWSSAINSRGVAQPVV
jgi:hypothetical protein